MLTWMLVHMQPLRVKGWDKALVEYTAAMLTDTSSESKPPLAKRLHEISCPGNSYNPINFPPSVKMG